MTAFRENPGKLIGELAYAHAFLEGSGRAFTAVVTELARRAGFQIAWEETNKQDYLSALTKELDDPKAGHLSAYLKPFIREGALDLEKSARTLTALPGLSAPDAPQKQTPMLTIVAGPNGAGKSTLTTSGKFGDQPVVDPDAIARSLNPDNPEAAATRAGKRALDLRNDYLGKGQSFLVETTLSGNSALTLIDEAKAQGFRVDLKYIGLEMKASQSRALQSASQLVAMTLHVKILNGGSLVRAKIYLKSSPRPIRLTSMTIRAERRIDMSPVSSVSSSVSRMRQAGQLMRPLTLHRMTSQKHRPFLN